MNNTAEEKVTVRPRLAVIISGGKDPLNIKDDGIPWEYNILLGKVAEFGIYNPVKATQICSVVRDMCVWPFNTGQVYDFTFEGASYRIEPQVDRTFFRSIL